MKIANYRGLLNIRNHNDQNCFKYCFIAAYHLHNNNSLELDGRNFNTERTSTKSNFDFERYLIFGENLAAVLQIQKYTKISDHHVLQTVSSNKVCLSALDNKRFFKADGVHALPFGHYENLDCGNDDIDWDNAGVECDHSSFDSNLYLSSDPERDNDFVVSQSSSTAAQSSAPGSWQGADPGFAAAQAVT